MTTLHMVDLALSARALAVGSARDRTADLGYRAHAVLGALFGELAPKPFALPDPATTDPSGLVRVLGYARADAGALLDHAHAFAEPRHLDALKDRTLASKPMPGFAAGRRLGFAVRVCPTVRRRHPWRDRTDGVGAEQDAYLTALDAAPGDRAPPEPPADEADAERPTREAVYGAWLRAAFARSGAVGENVSARLTDVRRERLFRRGAPDADGDRAGRPVELPAARFEGEVTVHDEVAFTALLARGLGRHRAFGFGMLLLRPPAR